MNVFMKNRSTKIILALLALAAVITAIVAYRHFSAPKIRHIVLISMDTTRADYLSCYGYQHKTTPNIDAVAAEAVRFEQAIAPIPLTLPSHSTMLTGTIPPYHGIHDNLNYMLADSNLTLAEMLKASGYTTGGIISSYVLEEGFGLGQGFDTYDDEFDEIDNQLGAERRGGEVSAHAIKWLDENRDEDFFLFLHYYDPHSPYDPPEPYRGLFGSIAAAEAIGLTDNTSLTADTDEKKKVFKLTYAEELAYTDHCIGQVINKLKSLDLYDSTLLIITGDHGEAFGEREEMGHGYYIYQESIHVPLIVKLPGQQTAKTVSGAVGLIDITPTVCSLLGIEAPQYIQGRDLSGALFDEPLEDDDRYIYSESLLATKYKASPLLAVTGNRFKYIQTARPELYDLIDDPGETHNLVDAQSQRARILQDVLGVMLEESLAAGTPDSALELDEESLKKLQSLGYVGGALEEDFSFDQDKADPKDTFQHHLDLMEIMGLMGTKEDLDAAEKACLAFISKGMEVAQVYVYLAQIAIAREDQPKAIDYLKKAVAVEPGTASAQAQLGVLLLDAEDYEQALVHLQEAHQIQPKSAMICYDVARAYYKLGQKEKAIEYCRKSLAKQPDYISPRANLAKALFELGDTPSAVNEYYKVIEYDAENLKALNFLAWIQATSRNGQLRKPQEALKLAQRAAKAADYKTAEVLDTLAVAYAATGDFEQAVTEADKAIALAESAGEAALAQRIARRRGLFKNGQSYNE
ncbi:MAG: sulfatase-like hydrolase/transferase [Planctomycetota bacterium]|jgi:arylsulfatase A-like enzyme/Flp pilus assembly protein TadD